MSTCRFSFLLKYSLGENSILSRCYIWILELCCFYIFIAFIHIVVHTLFVLSSINLKEVCGLLLLDLLWLRSANVLPMVFCGMVVVLYMYWRIQPMQLHTCAGQSWCTHRLAPTSVSHKFKRTIDRSLGKRKKRGHQTHDSDIRHMEQRFVSMQPSCCEIASSLGPDYLLFCYYKGNDCHKIG